MIWRVRNWKLHAIFQNKIKSNVNKIISILLTVYIYFYFHLSCQITATHPQAYDLIITVFHNNRDIKINQFTTFISRELVLKKGTNANFFLRIRRYLIITLCSLLPSSFFINFTVNLNPLKSRYTSKFCYTLIKKL